MKLIMTAKEAAELRGRTIEECARVAETLSGGIASSPAIAAAIRALKDK